MLAAESPATGLPAVSKVGDVECIGPVRGVQPLLGLPGIGQSSPWRTGRPPNKLLVVASMTQPTKAAPKVSEGSGSFLSAMFSSGTGDALAIDGMPKDGKDRIRVRSEAKAGL